MFRITLLAAVAAIGLANTASAQTAAEMRAAQATIEAEMRAMGAPTAGASMSAVPTMTPAEMAAFTAAMQAEANASATATTSDRVSPTRPNRTPPAR